MTAENNSASAKTNSRGHINVGQSSKARKTNRPRYIPYGIPYDIPPAEFHRMYNLAEKTHRIPVEWTFNKPIEADELLHRAEWIEQNKEWEMERIG